MNRELNTDVFRPGGRLNLMIAIAMLGILSLAAPLNSAANAQGSAPWGVNSGDSIYIRPSDGSGGWTQVEGGLKHVSVGSNWVWGVNLNDQIYKCKRPPA